MSVFSLSASPASGFSLNPTKTSSYLSFSSSINTIFAPLTSNTTKSFSGLTYKAALPRNLSLTCRHSDYFEPQQQQQQLQGKLCEVLLLMALHILWYFLFYELIMPQFVAITLDWFWVLEV